MIVRILLVSAASNLPSPDEEIREIREILRPLEEKGRIDVEEIRNAETVDIINHLRNHERSINIFHFAGHATHSRLVFQDQQGSSVGLAKLFQDHKHLAIAFLNACSTQDQVENFLQVGTGCIIGTTSEIDDATAKKFAIEFYKGLVREWTVQKSFEYAVAAAQFSSNFTSQNSTVIIPRGMGFADASVNLLPWGLYALKDKSAGALNWSVKKQLPLLRYLYVTLGAAAVIFVFLMAKPHIWPPTPQTATSADTIAGSAPDTQIQTTVTRSDSPAPNPHSAPGQNPNPVTTPAPPVVTPKDTVKAKPGPVFLIINKKDLDKNKIDFSITNPMDFPLTITDIYMSEKQKAMNLGNVKEIKRKELSKAVLKSGNTRTNLLSQNTTIEIDPKRTGTFSFQYQSAYEKTPGNTLQFMFKEKNKYDSTFLKVGEFYLEVEYIDISSGNPVKLEKYLFDRVSN